MESGHGGENQIDGTILEAGEELITAGDRLKSHGQPRAADGLSYRVSRSKIVRQKDDPRYGEKLIQHVIRLAVITSRTPFIHDRIRKKARTEIFAIGSRSNSGFRACQSLEQGSPAFVGSVGTMWRVAEPLLRNPRLSSYLMFTASLRDIFPNFVTNKSFRLSEQQARGRFEAAPVSPGSVVFFPVSDSTLVTAAG